MLQVLKEDTSTKYFIDCKSKGVYNSKLVPLYTVFFLFVCFFFLHNIKSFGHKIGIKFNKRVLVVEQNYKSILVVEQDNCATKVVNGASTCAYYMVIVIKLVIKVSMCIVAME